MPKVLQLDSRDNVLIALTDLRQGETVRQNARTFTLLSSVPAKHKFATQDLLAGASVTMYGVLVGRTSQPVRRGELFTTRNLHHQTDEYREKQHEFHWRGPDVSRWKQRTFMGYRRSDGQVGTRNYWLVVPLVFCENRNILNLKRATMSNPLLHRSALARP
jgi:altronate hydrolase